MLRIYDPNIVFDGTDMMAEVLLTIFGMVGMMEKHFIKARQRRGIDAAKLKGVYKGRPATISPEAVRELHQQGIGATEIAKRLHRSCQRLPGAGGIREHDGPVDHRAETLLVGAA